MAELVFGSPRPEDREPLAELLGTSDFKSVIWDWQFGRDPARAAPVTAYLGGRVVGFNGVMACEIDVAGKRLPAAWSCDFIVAPEYRRHGVGRALKIELDRRCPTVMALGTSEAAAAVLEKAGWRPGRGPRTYVRYGRAHGGLRGSLRSVLQALRAGMARLRGGSLVRTAAEISLQDVLPPADELDSLWERCAPEYDCAITRDSRYLAWRYAAHPLAAYHYIELRQNGALAALGIVRKGRDRAVLVDYAGPRWSRPLKSALVEAFCAFFSEYSLLECTTSDEDLRHALAREGFLGTGSGRARFFVRTSGENAPTVPADGWFLMGGDSDGEILAAARDASWKIREWSEGEFAENRAIWQELLEDSAADRLFLGWDWQHCWWEHFAARHSLVLRLAAAYDVHGHLVGLAPFFEHQVRGPLGVRFRRLEPIGNLSRGPATMRTEYLGLVLRKGQEEQAACKLWEYFHESAQWDDIVLQDWNVAAPGELALDEVAGGRCIRIDASHSEVDASRYAHLADGFTAYLDGLSGNARRSLFHRRRYLEDLGAVCVEYAKLEDVPEYFAGLNRLHALRWGEPVFTGHRLTFHEDLAGRLARLGRLRFSRLSVDGRVLSAVYNLRAGDREYNLQMGFDDSFHSDKISLGLLHLGYLMEAAANEGVKFFDLLAGPGKHGLFKHRIAPEKAPFARRQYLRSRRAKLVYGSWEGLRMLAGRR